MKPVSKQLSDQQQMQIMYAKLFSSDNGKAVLADLERRFYDGAMKGPDINRELGQRDVVLMIKNTVKRNGTRE